MGSPPCGSVPTPVWRAWFDDRHADELFTDLCVVLVSTEDDSTEDDTLPLEREFRTRGARVLVARSVAAATELVFGEDVHLLLVQLHPDDDALRHLIFDAMEWHAHLTCCARLIPWDVDVAIEFLEERVRSFQSVQRREEVDHVLDAVWEGLTVHIAFLLEEFFRAAAGTLHTHDAIAEIP